MSEEKEGERLFSIYAYILSGWRSIKNFIGPAFVQVASEMGEKMYEYLKIPKVISDEPCKTIDDAINVVLTACKKCEIPIDDISIEKASEKVVKFIFHEKPSQIPHVDVFKADSAWTYLPLPMLAMLFAIIKETIVKLKPIRFSAEYKENQWIYSITFSENVQNLFK